jgi:hypothetical protein
MQLVPLQRGGRQTPFLVLAPEYVHRKAWYAPLEKRRPDIFYMVPLQRYAFVAARGGRAQNTDVPCRHWARDGRCPRGDACPFLHGDGAAGASGVDASGAGGARGEGGGGGEGGEGRSGAGAGVASGTSGATQGSSSAAAVVVAPFDCVWHVHLGGETPAETRRLTQSVVQAWRQKFERGGKEGAGGVDGGGGGGGKAKGGVGAGVRLVASAAGLPPPPAKENQNTKYK